MECDAQCPYCGEPVSVWVDTGGLSEQRYVEDCPVCCRPWQVVVWREDEGDYRATLLSLDH